MSRILKIAGIGCGGLIALFVVLVIVGALLGGENTTTTSSSAEKEDEQAEERPKKDKDKGQQKGEPSGRIGDPVAVGDVEWTVTDAYRTNQLTGNFSPPKQGNFVVVDFIFKNNGNQAVTLDRQSLSLLDSSNREHSPDPDTFGYIPENKDLFLENVNPGVSREGEVVFTVPQDASGFRLQAGDANMFSNKNGYIDLGF